MDAGAAWGSLIHGLLEHAMRFPNRTREDLARLGQWLTLETTDLRAFMNEALDLVDAISKAPFWFAARRAGDPLVEVPFAVRIPPPVAAPCSPGSSDPGLVTPKAVDTVLHGVIDLVYRDAAGWRIVDYKSDLFEGMADVDTEMRARYGAQLAQYTLAWACATGDPVASADIVALRSNRVITAE